jgi:hypothetical protein
MGVRFAVAGALRVTVVSPASLELRGLCGRAGADMVASWGAALRFGAAESQDESRWSAIHKQRPYGP